MSATAETVKPEPAKAVTLAALRPQPENVAAMPAVPVGFLTLQSFELMQRVAKMFSTSSIVPDTYKNEVANCAIAVEMAQRLGASPVMVMQNLYVVYGRPAWSAKFLIACFNQCGRFSAVRYKWVGTEGHDDWGCRAWAVERATGEEIHGPLITIALAKKEGWYDKNGSKWKTIPQLMLMYRAAAWMINTHAPEISMGLQTSEEATDAFDTVRGADGQFRVNLQDVAPKTAAQQPPAPGTVVTATTEAPAAQAASAPAEPAPVVTEPEPVKEKRSRKAAASTAASDSTWENTLRGATSVDQLKAIWTDCCKAFAPQHPSLPVEAAYMEMQETLGEREGKML